MSLTEQQVIDISRAVLRVDPSEAEIVFYQDYSFNFAVTVMMTSNINTDFVRPIARLFQAAFGRKPDSAGLDHWVNAWIQASLPVSPTNPPGLAGMKEDLAPAFGASPEFTALYPTSDTDEQFITKVYNNVLGYAPDAAGLAYWMGRLGNDINRIELVCEFSESIQGVERYGGMLTDWQWDIANGEPGVYTGSFF